MKPSSASYFPEGYNWGRFVNAMGITLLHDVIYLFEDNDSPAYR